eukprot:scaffold5692_cov74-Phaeocystis_antarctica.AAC.2
MAVAQHSSVFRRMPVNKYSRTSAKLAAASSALRSFRSSASAAVWRGGTAGPSSTSPSIQAEQQASPRPSRRHTKARCRKKATAS